MPDKDLTFTDFLNDVDPQYKEFVENLHAQLLQNGCKLKLQLAKNGYVVSYSHDKRVLLNFVFRKNGLVVRIYGDRIGEYSDFLDSLPETMLKSIDKAPVCKLCNPKCLKGYDFAIKGNNYLKCRYNCFMFGVDDESIPFIKGFLEKELACRSR